jgi:protein gp37
MGDAFSRDSDFSFLEDEVIAPIRSPQGQRHFWLWLTKRPDRMARFGERIGGFPQNVCAMTTLTGLDKLHRIDELREVQASVRGLSVEPLWERIAPDNLNLDGISWLIVGGESGRKDAVCPFDLSWARELRDHCGERKVAFFLKQLGRRPVFEGEEISLRDGHGGDWSEWPEDLRVREVPEAFKLLR